MSDNYSELFYCLFDKKHSGAEGKSAHHSVFQAAVWHDKLMNPVSSAKVQRLAVIWDEDHDTRILDVLEEIYIKGLLSPILFIGERRGRVVVILDQEFICKTTEKQLLEYKSKIAEICQNPCHEDSWSVNFGWFNCVPVDGKYKANPDDLVYQGNGYNIMCAIHMEFRLGVDDFISVPRKHSGCEG